MTALQLEQVTKRFDGPGIFGLSRNGFEALKKVNITIETGQVYGLVGESGSGKTTTGRIAMGLETPTSGSVKVHGKDLRSVKGHDLRRFRKDFQMIFQDPFSSLNPRMTIGQSLLEAVKIQGLAASRSAAKSLVDESLGNVGIPADSLSKYPHQFSGGQLQRIGIARSLLSKPKLIIADEAVSALDVSIQAQILNLLKDLQEKLNLAMLFITHDLAVVRFIADRIGVMEHGEIIEEADTKHLFENPQHDYTRKLMESVPSLTISDRKVPPRRFTILN